MDTTTRTAWILAARAAQHAAEEGDPRLAEMIAQAIRNASAVIDQEIIFTMPLDPQKA